MLSHSLPLAVLRSTSTGMLWPGSSLLNGSGGGPPEELDEDELLLPRLPPPPPQLKLEVFLGLAGIVGGGWRGRCLGRFLEDEEHAWGGDLK